MYAIGNPLAPAKLIASQNSPLLEHPSPTGASWKRSSSIRWLARAIPVVVAEAIGKGAVGGRTPIGQLPICKSRPPAFSWPPLIKDCDFPTCAAKISAGV